MIRASTVAVLVAATAFAIGCRPKKRVNYGKPTSGPVAEPTGGAGATGGKYTLMPTTAASDLQHLTTDPIHEEHPVLSPDGGTLLVGLRTYDPDAQQMMYPGIVAISPTGGPGRTFLTQPGTQAQRAAWVPDGSTFVYATNAPGELALVRANSRSPGSGYKTIVASDVAKLTDYPSVAPDGLIAFDVVLQNMPMIATVKMNGDGYQLVQQGSYPAFSPDGKRMAFARNTGEQTHLFVSDRNGGAVMQLTFGKAYALWPTWSPDGQFIAFASNKGSEHLPDAQHHAQIYVIRATGGGVTQLTSGTSDCGFPHWGVDGHIYFNSDQAGNYDIWRLRPVLTAVGSTI